MTIIPVAHTEINLYREITDMRFVKDGVSTDILCVETVLNSEEDRSTARVLIYARDRDMGIVALDAQSDVPGQHRQLMRDEIDAFMDSYKKRLLFMSYGALAAPIAQYQ